MLDLYPWAKLEKPGEAPAWLSLEAHCLDVAMVFRFIALTPVVRSRLSSAAGRQVTAVDIERLSVLTLLHDLGKVNLGFARRIDPKAPKVGHIKPVGSLYQAEDGAARRICEEIADAVVEWLPESASAAYLAAVFSHHGRPLDPSQEDDHTLAGGQALLLWEESEGLSPERAFGDLLALARRSFPLAWAGGGQLPGTPAFIHLVAGLLMLADWIGSSTEFHPLQPRSDLARLRGEGFYEALAPRLRALGIDAAPGDISIAPEVLADVPSLRRLQQAVLDVEGQTVVAEGETGSGKTEAALLRWAHLRARGLVDGLYFALPTRVAAVEIHRRVAAFVGRYMGEEAGRSVVLALPGYAGGGGVAPPNPVGADDENVESALDDALWAAQRPKRFLAAQVAVGTIDQALLGIVRAKHAHMRFAALSRSLLVVDEVHASDIYTGVLTHRLLAAHRLVGGHSLLLSATLGGTARAALLGQGDGPSLSEAKAQPYPLVASASGIRKVKRDGRSKTVNLATDPSIDDPDRVAALAIAHAARDARVLVVRNTVKGALETAMAIEAMGEAGRLFSLDGVPTLHHGRFGAADRRRLDARVSELFGKGLGASGTILVGTQTLEQSLDIDADVLLTDLCPVDVLLQRLGRLHRHDARVRPTGYDAPSATVLVPQSLLSERIVRPRWGLGLSVSRGGSVGGGVYPNLVILEATRRLLEARPSWTVPDECRDLVESCVHPEAQEALLAELALSDPAWTRHSVQVDGGGFARSSAASLACWDPGKPFEAWTGSDAKEALTRLGGGDRRVVLPEGTRGPFGAHPGPLVVPHHLTPGLEGDVLPSDVVQAGGALTFRMGPFTLAYDRHGLTGLAAS